MAAPSRSRRGPGVRSGSTSGVQVVGLKEFRAELRKLDNPRGWTKELGRAQRELAKKVAEWSKSEASGMGGPFAKFANAIAGRGSVTGARIAIRDSKANATFWGAKKRTGWYGAARYRGSRGQQHPRWVGNSWDVGQPGQGPYAINAVIAARKDEIVEMYADAVEAIAAKAFPD